MRKLDINPQAELFFRRHGRYGELLGQLSAAVMQCRLYMSAVVKRTYLDASESSQGTAVEA